MRSGLAFLFGDVVCLAHERAAYLPGMLALAVVP
jgi:hypothetical protein